MRRNTTLLLGIGLITISLLLIGIYFYQRNEAAMCAMAEKLFVQVLNEEVQKKEKTLNLFHFFIGNSPDTIPLTIRIKSAAGEKEYKIDTMKSKKNISHSMKLRTMHSMFCKESPLLPDSLLGCWQRMLVNHQIDAISAVQIFNTDLQGRTTQLLSRGCIRDASSSVFSYYVGNRCEIEVSGCLAYTCQAVILYYWLPFLWIIVGLFVAIGLLFFYNKIACRPPKIKEVIREVILEKEISSEGEPQQIQQVNEVEKKKYQLSSMLLFDAHNKILIHSGQKLSLSAQHCLILELFLEAPGYTVSDSEILRTVWYGDSHVPIDYFRSSSHKLTRRLRELGFNISFKRVKRNSYCMLLIDAP